MSMMFRGLGDPRDRIDAISEPARRWIALIVVSLIGGLIGTIWVIEPRRTPWRIAADGVHVDSLVWRGFAPWSDINLAQARAINIAPGSEWRPVYRTNGYGGFHYGGGWWKLASGQEVEFYAAKTETKAVLLPRRSGKPLIVGADDPEALLAQARAQLIR